MLSFTSVKVSSFDLDNFVISWAVDLNPATQPVTDFRFFVQRSNATSGPFDELNAIALVDTFSFIDNQVNRLSKWRRFFYRIRALDTVSNAETISEVSQIAIPSLTEQKRYQLEIIRLERLLLQGVGAVPGFVGIKCLIFNRRTFGQRCTQCWDFLKKKVSVSRCLTCFGSGFNLGFHTPIIMHINFSPSSESPELSEIGEQQQNVIDAWTTNFPILTGGDLIIDQENIRWRVIGQSRTEMRRSPTRQMLKLYQISPDDIEYSVPFDPDLFNQ